MIIVRTYNLSDTEEIVTLFQETVQSVNSRDYTQKQIEAWISHPIDLDRWRDRLSSAFTYVATQEETIVGFGMLESNGHIDCFYCHKDFQGQGIGKKILQQIEFKARSLEINRLFSEVSITARLFFEGQGFQIVKQQEVVRNSQTLTNFVMEKHLTN